MTNRQAITVLKKIIAVADKSSSGIKEIDGTDEEAIQTAIKALEKKKYGYWRSYGKLWECSECHEISCCTAGYCGCCGTRMMEYESR